MASSVCIELSTPTCPDCGCKLGLFATHTDYCQWGVVKAAPYTLTTNVDSGAPYRVVYQQVRQQMLWDRVRPSFGNNCPRCSDQDYAVPMSQHTIEHMTVYQCGTCNYEARETSTAARLEFNQTYQDSRRR